MAEPPFTPHRLPYEIDSSSGHTSDYSPQKIILDSPQDANSRWTGVPKTNAAHSASRSGVTPSASATGAKSGEKGKGKGRRRVQYITLKLDAPSVLSAVGFGKHFKVHPCNLQDFSVKGGMSPDGRYMRTLLDSNLKNDSTAEKFELSTSAEQGKVVQPVRYVRIEALSPHQTNYNVAIWHVWLEGTNDPSTLAPVLAAYEQHRAIATHHLLLSHLRRTALLPTFRSLLGSSPLSANYEHPLISLLHSTLVEQGAFAQHPDGVEAVLHRWMEAGLFREWAPGGGKGRHVARWTRVRREAEGEGPSPRGGHQMVRCGRQLVLFGGYDGTNNFGDLWTYDLPTAAEAESAQGGPWVKVHGDYEGRKGEEGERPRERSCHQMVALESNEEGWVWVLGGIIGDDQLAEDGESEDDEDEDEENGFALPISIPTRTIAPFPSQRLGRTGGAPSPTGSAFPSATAPAQTGQGSSQPMEIDTSRDASLGLIPPEMAPAFNITPPDTNPPSPRSRPQDPAPVHQGRAKRRSSQKSDLWRYCVFGPRKGEWELVSADTQANAGPPRLWDHQMCVARGGRSLFVFGGRVERRVGVDHEEEEEEEGRYGGLWEYEIATDKWTLHLSDPSPGDAYQSSRLLARLGHALVVDSATDSLFVLGGQRKDTFLADCWKIDLNASTSPQGKVLPVQLTQDTAAHGGPPGTFSQRVIIEEGGWTVLSGTQQLSEHKEIQSQDIWVRPRAGQGVGEWEKCVRPAEEGGGGEEPLGRYAAQVVWDGERGESWLFGGNPALAGEKATRLNDLWRLRISRPSPSEALRKATFLVRKQRFAELCRSSPALDALEYLQTTLSAVVDHSDKEEAEAFRRCMSSLLNAPHQADEEMGSGEGGGSQEAGEDGEYEGRYAERQALFEVLCEKFVPRGDRACAEDLRDLCAQAEEDDD